MLILVVPLFVAGMAAMALESMGVAVALFGTAALILRFS
jgi:hypothetical protein